MSFSIDTNFPGGNIKVESQDGDVVHLASDLRDTTTAWFYWYFRVTGAQGRTITFVFDPANMGVRGPGVSLDHGVSWQWLGEDSVKDGAFFYTFGKDTGEVRFSVGMPYVRANWDRFLAPHRSNPFVQVETLTTTPNGRDVPLLVIENPVKKPSYCVILTGRHHACEMMASYTLDGVIEGVLAEDEAGKWLRENASFLIAPFMDTDGVEQGDQGKNRAPHDHNRDYKDEPIYSEVRAWKEHVPAWLEGRPLVSVDFHCPALCGPVHESVFFIEPEDRTMAARVDKLSEYLYRAQKEGGIARHPNKLAFGQGFNTTSVVGKRTNSAWSLSLPNALLGISLEVAYANASGSEVNAGSSHELGRAFAVALKNLLHEHQTVGSPA